MPYWRTAAQAIFIPPDAALLDTNVLISYIDPRDADHENTIAALDLFRFQYFVLYANLVEAWNWLAAKSKKPLLAYKMMEWALTPGAMTLIEDECSNISTARGFSERFGIDIVDACLADVASRLSAAIGLEPAVHVVTYDTADFMKLFGQSEMRFNVCDIRHLSSTTGEDLS